VLLAIEYSSFEAPVQLLWKREANERKSCKKEGKGRRRKIGSLGRRSRRIINIPGLARNGPGRQDVLLDIFKKGCGGAGSATVAEAVIPVHPAYYTCGGCRFMQSMCT
jgi:hypothetical protein